MPVKYSTFPTWSAQDRERFIKKIHIGQEHECWEWLAGRNTHGYRQFNAQRLNIPASRAAYIYFYGTDPGTLLVLHSCDNPPCCNPAHLRLGTNDDNMADKVKRGRQCSGDRLRASFGDRSGERNGGRAKLTTAQVREIRRRKSEGAKGIDLAAEFHVTPTLISRIWLRKAWRHIE